MTVALSCSLLCGPKEHPQLCKKPLVWIRMGTYHHGKLPGGGGFELGLKEGLRETRKVERGHAEHVDHVLAIARRWAWSCMHDSMSIFLVQGSRTFSGFAGNPVTPERIKRSYPIALPVPVDCPAPAWDTPPHFPGTPLGVLSPWVCQMNLDLVSAAHLSLFPTRPASVPWGVRPSWLGGTTGEGRPTPHPKPALPQ